MLEIKNGNILSPDCKQFLPKNTSVFIDGDTISYVGAEKGFNKQPHLTIDANNAYLVPGLFNTHCHLQMNFPAVVTSYNDLLKMKLYRKKQIIHTLKKCVEHGITTIRDTHTDRWINNHNYINAITDGKIVGPRIYQSIAIKLQQVQKESMVQKFVHGTMGLPGRDLEGPASGTIYVPNPSKYNFIKAIEILKTKRNGHFLKLYEPQHRSLEKNEKEYGYLKQLINIASDKNVISTMHHTSTNSFIKAKDLGLRSLAHLPINGLLKESEMEKVQGSDTIVEPTLSLMYAYCYAIKKINRNLNLETQKHLDQLRDATLSTLVQEHWIPELHKNINEGIKRLQNDQFKTIGKFDMSGIFKFYSRYLNQGISNLEKMYEAGIKIAVGNDAGTPPLTPAMINLELKLINMVLNQTHPTGISGSDLLRCATLNSAKTLGLDKQLGSIKENKLADIVFYKSNPLKDSEIIGSKALAVMKNGRFIENRIPFQTLAGVHLNVH